MKSGNLNFLEPSGPLQACNGTDFFYVLEKQIEMTNVKVIHYFSKVTHTPVEIISVSLKDSPYSANLLFLIHTRSKKNGAFDDVLQRLLNVNISCHHLRALHDLEIAYHLRHYTFTSDSTPYRPYRYVDVSKGKAIFFLFIIRWHNSFPPTPISRTTSMANGSADSDQYDLSAV